MSPILSILYTSGKLGEALLVETFPLSQCLKLLSDFLQDSNQALNEIKEDNAVTWVLYFINELCGR
jgi:hypothetical protein